MWENNQKKSRFAIVLIGSNPYLPGINGIINALDYYGNKIDLHFIHDELPEEYLNEIKNSDLNYRLVLRDFTELRDAMIHEWPNFSPRNKYHEHTWLRYWYLMQIKDEYEVTAVLDADSIVLNNITPWFEFTAGTDYLLTAYHYFAPIDIENYKIKNLLISLPVFNHPLICDPKIWADIFQAMFEREEKFHESDMRCLNRVLLLNNRLKKVFVLLDCEWIGGYIWISELRKRELDGKQYLLGTPNKFRINVLHGKWWGEGFRESQLKGAAPNNQEKMRNNLKLICEMYRMLNLNHKVKISVIKDISPNWDVCI